MGAHSAEIVSIYDSVAYEFLKKKAVRAARKMFQYINFFMLLMNFLREGLFVMIQAARSAEFVLEVVYLCACLRTSRNHPETVENTCLLV